MRLTAPCRQPASYRDNKEHESHEADNQCRRHPHPATDQDRQQHHHGKDHRRCNDRSPRSAATLCHETNLYTAETVAGVPVRVLRLRLPRSGGIRAGAPDLRASRLATGSRCTPPRLCAKRKAARLVTTRRLWMVWPHLRANISQHAPITPDAHWPPLPMRSTNPSRRPGSNVKIYCPRPNILVQPKLY